MMAKECLLKNLPAGDLESMLDNPMSEMRHIWTVRSHLENADFPFKAAYDIKTKKVHYYYKKDDVKMLIDSRFPDLTNESVSDANDPEFEKVLLNKNLEYVENNIIIENDEETLNENSSITTVLGDNYVFVPNDIIYSSISILMKTDS
jgi:hypothetical protein